MRRHRRHREEPENHERWLVSYADFITLLFAFFVVMYAVSSVNEGKYRVLSETLNAVFADPENADPRLPAAAAAPPAEAVLPDPPPIPDPIPIAPAAALAAARSANLIDLREQLADSLASYVRDRQIEIGSDAKRIEVRIKSGLLFGSGSAELGEAARAPLRAVARILAPLDNVVQVEGHTDDVPISTLQFPSNWELSAARAASVVHFLSRLGVADRRLAAVGFGEHRPVAANDDAEGRARNRRVTLTVLAPEEIAWAEGPSVPESGSTAPGGTGAPDTRGRP